MFFENESDWYKRSTLLDSRLSIPPGPVKSLELAMAFRDESSAEELAEVLAVTIEMGGGPSAVYASRALEAFDTFTAEMI